MQRKGEEVKNKFIIIRVTDKFKKDTTALAKSRGQTISEFGRDAIDKRVYEEN